MKIATLAILLFCCLSTPFSRAENQVAEHYGWDTLGGGWYASHAYGPVRLEESFAGGAWGWSEAFAARMFFSLYRSDSDWRYIYHEPWRAWLATIDQGEHAVFPRLYLLDHTEEVEAAVDAGALLQGAKNSGVLDGIEGVGWVLATVDFEQAAPQTRAYASVLNTAIWASGQATRILAERLQDATDPAEAAEINLAFEGINQALGQSVLGITQALSQSISQAATDSPDLALLANDYATAYRMMVKDLLQLAEDNDLGLFPALAQALNGMSQALAQGYVGTSQALSQGYVGLRTARESGLSPERLQVAETDFSQVTGSYTFNYGAESASFAAAAASFQGQSVNAERFLEFTQAASQAHVGMTQSMAQSYLGITQAIFAQAENAASRLLHFRRLRPPTMAEHPAPSGKR